MMGRQDRQMAIVFMDMESLIPENHLLRKIDRIISFEFIYDLLAPYYPSIGRPSVDLPSVCSRCFWWAIYMASNQNAGWRRK